MEPTALFAPGVPELMREFHNHNSAIEAFVVSIYNLGLALGPLVVAPVSEVFGRVKIYHVCNTIFFLSVVGCALSPNVQCLIAFRFLSGAFGSVCTVNGGGTIADMVPQESRASTMAVFSVGPLLGPITGPIIGGILTTAKGWRWTFWLEAIASGLLSIIMMLVMKESYHPVILERKTARLRKTSGNQLLRSKFYSGLSLTQILKRSIMRPLKILFYAPIVTFMAIYVAITYGYLFLMFASLAQIFQNYYNFSTTASGLAFLGVGLGSLIGVGIFRLTSDRYMAWKTAKADAAANSIGQAREGMKPEYRLMTLPIGGILIPIGLIIYGWTVQYHIHWVVPITAMGLIGCGSVFINTSVQMYLVDTYHVYAASALAANVVLRSLVGAFLPLSGLRMYDDLGMGWGNTLLGFIALLFMPLIIVIMKRGEYLRKRFVIESL